jgi:hypothetical protein
MAAMERDTAMIVCQIHASVWALSSIFAPSPARVISGISRIVRMDATMTVAAISVIPIASGVRAVMFKPVCHYLVAIIGPIPNTAALPVVMAMASAMSVCWIQDVAPT